MNYVLTMRSGEGKNIFIPHFLRKTEKKVWRKYEVDEGTRERDREKKA